MVVRLLWLAGALVALVYAAPLAAATPESSATALGVRVVVPGGIGATSIAVASPPRRDAEGGGFTFPEGGAAVSTGPLSVESRARFSPDPGSFARAEVAAVSLFSGEITAGRIYVQAGARATPTAAGGQLSASTIEDLVVLGVPVEPVPNQQLPLGDWGYVVVLEQAVVTEDVPAPGYRGFVVGLHVHLTADHGGLPAGSELLVGYAESAVRSGVGDVEEAPVAEEPPATEEPQPGEAAAEPEPAEPAAPEPGASEEQAGGEPVETAPPPAEDRPPPPAEPSPAEPPIRTEAPEVRPQFTGEGFVFPVYGPAGFTNDYGAARASTGWHHGNDIFAPLGAPVLAPTGGELFLVGWNAVGGHRLWLRDDAGNEFYFAHLSAYTPLAQNGARVEAGDVVGFVGASGDAVGTPPHLHFEIHPRELLDLGYDGVINPFEFLAAWQRARDADIQFAQTVPESGPALDPTAPPPAAVPLGYVDISLASGLDTAGLERVLSFPSTVAEGSYKLLVLPQRSPLVGAGPGFASG